MKITSGHIVDLLEKRHQNEIFIPECNIGSSYADISGRLDAWAIKRAYTNGMSWGYEIKVDRSDFLNDDKWQKYLSCCKQFYFVCPTGLIGKEEVPEEAGLIYVTKSGNRLLRKKKAKTRNITYPENFFMSILFNRVTIKRRPFIEEETKEDRIERYKYLLRNRKGIDRIVKWKINKAIHDLEVRTKKAENELKKIQEVKDLLDSRGITTSNYHSVVSAVESEILGNTDFVKSVDNLHYPINSTIRLLSELSEQIIKIRERTHGENDR